MLSTRFANLHLSTPHQHRKLATAHRSSSIVPAFRRPQDGSAVQSEESTSSMVMKGTIAAAILSQFVLPVGEAVAAQGEYGVLEGRTAALVHPALMLFLLGATGWAGYLGFQWRRTRTLPEEIKSLKAQLPAAGEDGARPASPLDSKIKELEQERKTLISGNYRDKHWQWSALLLAMGTGIAIEGAANTYMRTGKLFPGPHLYWGAAIVFIWALAASLVPQMQKGNDTARTAHIGLNVLNSLLFLSQVPTGLEIVGKVFEFTVWP